MPRKKRIWEPGRCYHIMLRGIDGRAIFIDDRDRCRFCLLLQEASELHKFRVHVFCLMTNHIHLLLESLDDGLAIGVHRFATRYAQHFNRRYKKSGYVFQGRFRSILVEGGTYMKRLMRYIHFNPLEAGLVSRPQDYPWSSHHDYFSQSRFAWLETDRILSYFGPSHAVAKINLAEFMDARIDGEDLKEIEQASRSGVYGSEEFKRAFVTTGALIEQARDKKFSLEPLIDKVCTRLGITMDQLCSDEKTRNLVDARAILACAAQLLGGLNHSEVSRALNKHQSTISRLANRAVSSPKLQIIVNELVNSVS